MHKYIGEEDYKGDVQSQVSSSSPARQSGKAAGLGDCNKGGFAPQSKRDLNFAVLLCVFVSCFPKAERRSPFCETKIQFILKAILGETTK